MGEVIAQRWHGVLGVGDGNADLMKTDGIEDFQRLTHCYKVRGVI